MQKQKSIIGGVILIAVGGFILLGQLVPGFGSLFDLGRNWPLIIVIIGGFFLLSALFGAADLAIPGSIITGLGLLFLYQNLSGNWASWAYAWALIPGFVGIGMFITGALDKSRHTMRREGGRLILISAVLFLLFGFFFTSSWWLIRYWPILLIVTGFWLLIRSRKSNEWT